MSETRGAALLLSSSSLLLYITKIGGNGGDGAGKKERARHKAGFVRDNVATVPTI